MCYVVFSNEVHVEKSEEAHIVEFSTWMPFIWWKICVLTDDATCLVSCDRLAAAEIRHFNLMYKYPAVLMCQRVWQRDTQREMQKKKLWFINTTVYIWHLLWVK